MNGFRLFTPSQGKLALFSLRANFQTACDLFGFVLHYPVVIHRERLENGTSLPVRSTFELSGWWGTSIRDSLDIFDHGVPVVAHLTARVRLAEHTVAETPALPLFAVSFHGNCARKRDFVSYFSAWECFL